ncbi:hypothetical protein BJP40_06370 [Streptomyces sp. CC53]|uniref:hypothetical protein n=1 Tax=Streptomyces sp. CC53 TaxID=1906740 RepID=UPI0008DE6FF4|nr:hypothetical protein [Streptomyces sp. CC53]OII61147.1 hypothetical protein BJP40_06370 [Streptomyces sp. CC53]
MNGDDEFIRLSQRLEKEMTAGPVAAWISRTAAAVLAVLIAALLLLAAATAGAGLALALVTILEVF